MCVCVCVCVCESEAQTDRDTETESALHCLSMVPCPQQEPNRCFLSVRQVFLPSNYWLILPSICKVLGQALLVGGGDVNTRGDGDCGSGWERGSLDLKEWKGAPS